MDYAQEMTQNGIRPSIQRLAIYRYVKESSSHPTVDMVYTQLHAEYPTLSRTTVYNTLHLLSEKGLLKTLNIDTDEQRYDGMLKKHIHFKCIKCKKIYDLMDDDGIKQFDECCTRILPKGFSTENTELNLWGTCSECAAAVTESEKN